MSAFEKCEREMTKGRARWQHHFILELSIKLTHSGQRCWKLLMQMDWCHDTLHMTSSLSLHPCFQGWVNHTASALPAT